MEPVEYVFRIDAFTPENFPMARLAEYLAALARLIGHTDHTHFVRLDPGSARIVHKVESVDVPKVESRLDDVKVGAAPKDAMSAYNVLEALLANDNAVGTLAESLTGRVVIPFIGRNRAKPLAFPPFRQDTSIVGQIISIGGRDSTAHAVLQDGDVFHTNLSMKRDLARDLAPLLYGPTVKLTGNGRFERQDDGRWKLLDFRVDRFDKLDDRTIVDTLAEIRTLRNNPLMDEEVYRQLRDLNSEGRDDH